MGSVTANNVLAASRSRTGIARSLQRGAAIGTMAAILATAVPNQARASQEGGRSGSRTAVAAGVRHEARGSLPPLSEMIATATERAGSSNGRSGGPTILEKDKDRYCEGGRDSQRVLEASAEHQHARVSYREAVAEHNAGIDAATNRTKRNMAVSAAAAVGVIIASNAIGSKAHRHGIMPRTTAKPGKYIAIGAAAIGVYRTLRDAQTQPGGMTLKRAKHVAIPEHLSARFDQKIVRAPDCRDTVTATVTPRKQGVGGPATAAARSIRQQMAEVVTKTWSSVRAAVTPAARTGPHNTATAQAAARVLSQNAPSGPIRNRQGPANRGTSEIAGNGRTEVGRATLVAPVRPTISRPERSGAMRAPGHGNGNNRIQQSGHGATR